MGFRDMEGDGGEGGSWHPLVVASPGDGAVLIAALLSLVLGSTATGLGQ